MRTVLVATLGNSPQVVTETLWALMNPERTETKRPREDARIPFRTHMIATGFIAGREGEIRERIAELYRRCGQEPPKDGDIVFDAVLDDSGKPLDDIRTARDNRFFARHIAETVRDYARDESLRIHLSLAGGRKTMSSYALSAAMFYGRPHDEISHVLVNPPELERVRDFWWPGQPGGEVVLKGRGEKPDTRIPTAVDAASVDLVSVPFVPLYPFFEEGVPMEATDPAALADRIRAYLRSDTLTVDFDDQEIAIGGERIGLSEKQFAMYALLAVAKRKNWAGAGPGGVGKEHRGWVAHRDYLDPSKQAGRALLEIGHEITSRDVTWIEALKQNKLGKSQFWNDPLKSDWIKLDKSLRKKFDNPFLVRLLQPVRRGKPAKRASFSSYTIRHGLALPSEKIELRNPSPELSRIMSA